MDKKLTPIEVLRMIKDDPGNILSKESWKALELCIREADDE